MESANTNFSEFDAGIREFLNKEAIAMQATIKHRYSDFIVNEIDPDGKVVWF
jgi:hypothetical protein